MDRIHLLRDHVGKDDCVQVGERSMPTGVGGARESISQRFEFAARGERAGPIEVEIFNQKVWDSPGDEVLALVKERFVKVC